MNPSAMSHRYEAGPTSCMARPSVVKSISREIKENRVLSAADVRLALTQGLITSDSVQLPGLNDGLFYPPGFEPEASRSARPVVRFSLAASPADEVRTMHTLALLVDFKDNTGKRPAAEFADLIFNSAKPGSMASYYQKLSGGRLKVTGEVFGYLRMPQPYAYYANGESGMGTGSYPRNGPGLMFDALTKFCEKNSLAPFDGDGDGFVDGIFLIHAGSGAEAEPNSANRKKMIWSHKWTLPDPFVNNGVRAYAYSTEPEDGKVGVFTHEFGHVLGLPDLYDTSYRSRGIGDWCLMAGGEWGGGGDKPCRMSAWCLSKLGWTRPKVVRGAADLVIPTLEADPNSCYRLWTGGKAGLEYFLIENRQAMGMDVSLPGSGLAVWHVDEAQSANDNPLAFKVALIQADGTKDLEFNRNGGDDGDLFPGSKNVSSLTDTTVPSTRSNQGGITGVSFKQIKMADGRVTVKVDV